MTSITTSLSEGDRLAHGIVGSWQVVEDVRVELGLAQVVRNPRREQSFRRSDPMRDVNPRRDRIAAVGISVSF
jgi:hypothetical protein